MYRYEWGVGVRRSDGQGGEVRGKAERWEGEA